MPTAGLMTAIVAGFVAALFGGSNVQVSGPTGAMTVVLVPIVAKYGADAALVVAFIAGILLVAAAFARLGRLLAYFPWPVVEGFTVGIAVVIFLQQVPHALGITSASGEGSMWLAAQAVRDALDARNLPALALVALTIAVMLALPRVHRALPASLIGDRGGHDRGRADRRRCRSDRRAPGFAADAIASGAWRRPAGRSLRGGAGGGGAGVDRKPAVGQGRGRDVRHRPPRSRTRTVRPGPRQRRRLDVRRDAGDRRDRADRRERPGRRANPGLGDGPLGAVRSSSSCSPGRSSPRSRWPRWPAC